MSLGAVTHDRTLRPIQLRVVGICVLLNVLDGYDIMALAFAAPSLARTLQLGPESLGAVFAASAAGTAIGAMLLGGIADRVGRRRMILASLTLITMTTLTTALARDAFDLLLTRLINGVGVGGMLASLTAIAAEFSSDRQRNTIIGTVHGGYLLGAIVGGLIGSWLIPAYGWPTMFLAGGAIMLVVLPLAYVLLPESLLYLLHRQPTGYEERARRILEALGKSSAFGDIAHTASAAPSRGGVRGLFDATHRRATLSLWAAFFLVFLSMYFVQSWIPKILGDAGLPLRDAILAGTALNVGGAVGSVLIGATSTRIGLRVAIGVALLGAAGLMLLMSVLPAVTHYVLPVCFVLGLLVFGGFIGLYVLAARIYDTPLRATGVGWAVGAARLGAVVSPSLAGLILGQGWSATATFVLFAVPLLIAAIVVGLSPQPASAPGALREAAFAETQLSETP